MDFHKEGCKSYLQVNCNLSGNEFGYEPSFQCKGSKADVKDIWNLINYDDRIYSDGDNWNFLDSFFKDWAIDKMRKTGRSQQTFKVPVGKLYFFETMLIGEHGNYQAEPFQTIWLLTPSNKKCVTSTRRGTKTTTLCQAEPLYDAVMNKGYPTVIITQGWETAQKHLEAIKMWCDNNKRLEIWAGGRREPWSKTEMWFKNRSYLKAFTGSSTDKLRGLTPAPRRIVRDELAFHDSDSPEAVIIKMGTGSSQDDIVTSTPIAGDNMFSRVQINRAYDHFFMPLYCPKGYERYHCDATCKYFNWHGLDDDMKLPLPECKATIPYDEITGFPDFDGSFWRIPNKRVSKDDILDNFEEIGMMRFEQEFLLRPHSLEGNIFTKPYLDQYVFDRDMMVEEANYKNEIFIGVDYGLTKHSRSVIAIGKKITEDHGEDGVKEKLRLINLKVFDINTPFKSIMRYIGDDLLDSYRIVRIVCDANTPSKNHVENELIPFLREKRNYEGDIVPYHTLGQGGKDFHAKAELIDSAKNKFELGERLRFFKDKELYSEMLSLRGRETDSGNLVIESSSTTDRFMACMYMVWGAFSKPSSGIVHFELGKDHTVYSDWVGGIE